MKYDTIDEILSDLDKAASDISYMCFLSQTPTSTISKPLAAQLKDAKHAIDVCMTTILIEAEAAQ